MQLRIMTFNIRNGLANDGIHAWENRKKYTANVIQDEAPDIIGLQEVYDFQLLYLLERLPEYAYYSIGREDGANRGEQCTILWKRSLFRREKAGTFWLSDTPSIPNSTTWGNRVTRICSWVQFAEGLTFLNTHWDHESVPARIKSAQYQIENLPSGPWILVGDFNAEPNSEEIQTLTGHASLEFLTKGNLHGTFHDYKGGDQGERIDHMFASTGTQSKELRVLANKFGNLYPSDHYPVVCDLDVRL